MATTTGKSALYKMVGRRGLRRLNNVIENLEREALFAHQTKSIFDTLYLAQLTDQVIAGTTPRAVTPLEHFEEIYRAASEGERQSLDVIRQDLFLSRPKLSAQRIFMGDTSLDNPSETRLPLEQFAGQYQILKVDGLEKEITTLTLYPDGSVDLTIQDIIPTPKADRDSIITTEGRGRARRDGESDNLIVEVHDHRGATRVYHYDNMLSLSNGFTRPLNMVTSVRTYDAQGSNKGVKQVTIRQITFANPRKDLVATEEEPPFIPVY